MNVHGTQFPMLPCPTLVRYRDRPGASCVLRVVPTMLRLAPAGRHSPARFVIDARDLDDGRMHELWLDGLSGFPPGHGPTAHQLMAAAEYLQRRRAGSFAASLEVGP